MVNLRHLYMNNSSVWKSFSKFLDHWNRSWSYSVARFDHKKVPKVGGWSESTEEQSTTEFIINKSSIKDSNMSLVQIKAAIKQL